MLSDSVEYLVRDLLHRIFLGNQGRPFIFAALIRISGRAASEMEIGAPLRLNESVPVT